MQIVQGIYLPDGDTHFRKHLESNPIIDGKGTYQFEKLRMALDLGRGRGRAVDVGAHVGLWSRVLVTEFESVVAFEPILAHIECFERNLPNVLNVTLHDYALGDHTGMVKMSAGGDNSGNAHLSSDGEIEVAMRRLDGLDLAPIDFLKIDVEGAELQVLLGGEQTIRRDKPFMIVEQKGDKGPAGRAAVDLLVSWGAQVKWRKSGDYGVAWS